jgi:hypothetical protein
MLLLRGTRTQRCCDRSLTLPVPGKAVLSYVTWSCTAWLRIRVLPLGRERPRAGLPAWPRPYSPLRPPWITGALALLPQSGPACSAAGCPYGVCLGCAWAATRIRDGLARRVASHICVAGHAAATLRVSSQQRPPLDSQHWCRRSRLSVPCPSAAAAVPRVAPA